MISIMVSPVIAAAVTIQPLSFFGGRLYMSTPFPIWLRLSRLRWRCMSMWSWLFPLGIAIVNETTGLIGYAGKAVDDYDGDDG